MLKTREKSPQQKAADSMSAAQKLARALSSGILKSNLRTVQEAIYIARALWTQAPVTAKNYRTVNGQPLQLSEGDFEVAIAYMTPDLTTLNTWPYDPKREGEILDELLGPGKCTIPVGLIFAILDHERGTRQQGARPFLNAEIVKFALEQRLKQEFDSNA